MTHDLEGAGTPNAPSGWGRLWAALALAGVALLAMVLAAAVAVFAFMLAGRGPFDAASLGAPVGAEPSATLADGVALLEITTVGQLVGGGVALLFVALLGGRSLVRPRSEGVRFAVRTCWPLVASAAVLLVLGVVAELLLEGASLRDIFGRPSAGWPSQLLLIAAFCLSVGLFEEGLCRGLLLEGLLARMGATRRGIIGAIVLSSLAFGLAHVVGADLSSPLGLVQAALKILQTGIVGAILAVVVLRTGNLWCAVVVHALFDFLSMAPYAFGDMGEFARALAEPYVSVGDDAPVVVITYLVAIALSLPSLVPCLRLLRGVPAPGRGVFYVAGRVVGGRPPVPAGVSAGVPAGSGAGRPTRDPRPRGW